MPGPYRARRCRVDLTLWRVGRSVRGAVRGVRTETGRADMPKTEDRVQLPRIIMFESKTDSGEYGNATCPHCGADGRYVWWFRCEDGTRRGAMAGCIRLFPVSQIAKAHQAIIDKAAKYEKKGWSLPSWDQSKLEAIEAYAAGEITEGDALRTIEDADRKARAYRQRRYGRRR